MAQLMPLPLTVSCFTKIQIGFTFLVPAHLGSPGKGPLNGCVCVCVCVCTLQNDRDTSVFLVLTLLHSLQKNVLAWLSVWSEVQTCIWFSRCHCHSLSRFSKIQTGFTYLVPAHPGSPRQMAVKRVCVCVQS